MSKTRALIKKEKGASTVEFAIVLPVLVTILVGIFQLGIAFNGYLAITHAAREGARQASVGNYDEQTVRSDSYPVKPTVVSLSYPEGEGHGLPIRVTVRYDYSLSIPFFGNQVIPLESHAEMRAETL